MLFSYKYINHSMEKMQEFVDYIFFKVWCEARNHNYEMTLFDGAPDLKDIITALHFTEPKSAEFFIKGIQKIFNIFKTLSQNEIDRLIVWYLSNNSIESLCKNDPVVFPATYSNIDGMNTKLGAEFKAFYVGLYSQDFLSLKVFSDKVGSIDDHYKEFVKTNSQGKCPFCGLHSIDGEYDHTREAYDHYLPKSKYPFTSINLKNLAPICSKCNSGNKSSKDPLHDRNGNRRKAFYPYNTNPYNLQIDVTVNSNDLENLTPQDININFGPNSLAEEITTWNDLFNIENRYKAVCCSSDAKYWIAQIFEECGDRSPYDFLSIRLECAQKYPFSEMNFLRVPFLRACEEQHIFSRQ